MGDFEYKISDIGPALLAASAILMLFQGLVYIIRPDMTGRAVSKTSRQIRKLGIIILLASAFLIYISFLWWMNTWSIDPRSPSP